MSFSRKILAGMVAVTGFLAAPAAFAWGCKGHEIVVYVAERHMTPQAQRMVARLLAQNPEIVGRGAAGISGNNTGQVKKKYCRNAGADLMAEASTWADDERVSKPATGAWHFINIALNAGRDGAKDFCGARGCVTQAIAEQLAILKDRRVSAAEQGAALRFVIHLVGDLHQPLHATTNNDRGGNCVPLKYFRRNVHRKRGGYEPNLHHIWDVEILERELHHQDLRKFAGQLDETFAESETEWVGAGMRLEDWAWESHELAARVAYRGFSVPVEQEVAVKSCADDGGIGERMLRENIFVGAEYQRVAAPVVAKRLVQAGVRLAMILNEVATDNRLQ